MSNNVPPSYLTQEAWENKKEYNRLRRQKEYEDFKQRRVAVIEAISNGVCFLCGANSNLHLHHAMYHPTESDYAKNSKTMSVRWKRLEEAEAHPVRFIVLCARCHHNVEEFKRFIANNSINIDRLLRLL